MKSVPYASLSGTLGFEALIVFFNKCLVIMALLTTLGIAAQLNLGEALAELESLATDINAWEVRFGNEMSLDSMKGMTTAFFMVASVACFLLSALLLVVISRGVSVGASQGANRITTYFMTLNNGLLPAFIMVMLYYTLASNA